MLSCVQEQSGIPEVPSGSKSSSSPPLDGSLTLSDEGSLSVDNPPGYNEEATHSIPEECERLFCDTLSAIFLGGRKLARQESLGMDAYRYNQSTYTIEAHERILSWIEVWDYGSDAIYRGFVTDMGDERALFVFFGDGAVGHGLKSG